MSSHHHHHHHHHHQSSVKAPTAFTVGESTVPESALVADNGDEGDDIQMTVDSGEQPELQLLPDRLRKRLQSERKCRPTNEQLDLKQARAEQRRQKQFAKRAASAREADARCRRVAEAMEALHARRPESRAQVMQRFVRLQRDLQTVLGRFNTEVVEATSCPLFADAPLTFGGGCVAFNTAQQKQQQQQQQQQQQRSGSTAFVVGECVAELPARLRQRLAAYPRRRGRHELKLALEKKLADAQRRKERYEQRRAESIKDTEERCRRISETMEEISLDQGEQQQQQQQQETPATSQQSSSGSNGDYYRRVAKLQVDLDCLFTKFNREIVTVRGRPVHLLDEVLAQQQQKQQQKQQQQQRKQEFQQRSASCQTDDLECHNCGCKL